MHIVAFTLLAVTVLVAADDSSEPENGLEFSVNLATDINLQWGYDKEWITLKLQAPTKGWIGVGFSRTGSMNGADMIMMGVKDGSPYALDTHAERNGVPLVDESQDVEILSGWENGTHTSVTVTRKRVTCDNDDMSIKQGTYRIIWAYGSSDLSGNTLSFSNYHERNRGVLSQKLINRKNRGPPSGESKTSKEELKYFDIVATNYTVPPIPTHYLCQMFKLPEGRKIHIVKFEILVQPGHEKFVHHSIIALCEEPKDFQFARQPLSCYKDISRFSRAKCYNMLAGWAVGVTAVEFPNDVGFPIGGADDLKYVMLETHYDNPDSLQFPDASGMRFYYTENLRKHDAGIIVVTQIPSSIWIPPGVEKFHSQGHCSETCLNKGFDDAGRDEVTVIGTVLHAHLAARSMRLRHIRNGVELEPLAKDDFYDFDYQESQYIDDGKVKIKRGDSMMIQCDYGSLDRKEMTLGGLSTNDEMCVAFVLYYPRTKIDFCDSISIFTTDPMKSQQLLDGLNITLPPDEYLKLLAPVRDPRITDAKGIKKYLDKVEWTAEKVAFAQTFFDNIAANPYCVVNSEFVMDTKEIINIPEFTEYVEREECGDESYKGSLKTSAAYLVVALTLIMVVAKSKITFH